MSKDTKTSNVQAAPPASSQTDSAQPKSSEVDADERHRRISDAAYYRAERRGFAPGADQEDWHEAEKELDGPS
jgi:hypothetical protein